MVVSRLQALLASRQLSQRAMARLSGLDRATIAKLCKDEWAMIDRLTLATLCQALDVSPGEVLVYESTETPESAPATD